MTDGVTLQRQLRFALPCEPPNSLFRSLRPSEIRGQSQENALFAQLPALMRARASFGAAACCLSGLATGTGTLAGSLFSETCCTCCCCCCCLTVNAVAMVLRRSLSR